MGTMEANFFIADRLRGIPLVSGSRKRETLASETPIITSASTSTSAPPQDTKVTGPLAMALIRQQNQTADKRTATMANEKPKMPKVVTSTPASQARKRTTTTRRPPKSSSQRPTKQLNPPTQSNKYKSSKLSSSTTTTIKPTTVVPTEHAKLAKLAHEQTRTMPQTKPDAIRSSVDYANGPANQLTRANQSDKSDFGYQRRNPQTVLMPRYTNKPNELRPVGENWVIFNRNDGQMSAFEVIALISNIMIVSSIVLVILFNWFKSFKKRKRADLQKRQEDPKKVVVESRQLAPESSGVGSPRPASGRPYDGSSELARSMMGSGLGGASAIDKVKQQQRPASENPNSKAPDDASKPNFADQTNQGGDHRFGSPHNISSEFKGGAQAMANKAMAIVQPTENMDTNSGSLNEKEKLASAIREELAPKDPPAAVQRSASSISGTSDKKQAPPPRVTTPLITTNAQASSPSGQPRPKPEKANKPPDGSQVEALEQLFDGQGGGSSGGRKLKADPGERKLVRASSRLSASSLESTELPGPLVESIKRSDPNDSAHADPPSPNLLLGEVGATEASAMDAPMVVDKPPPPPPPPSTGNKDEKVGSSSSKVKDGPDNRQQQMAKSRSEQVAGAKQPEKKSENANERPANPMGRDEVDSQGPKGPDADANELAAAQTRVKNHQVVVNKLDKRKTNLEIVDLRDESVTGKMRGDKTRAAGGPKKSSEGGDVAGEDKSGGQWISMDGVAVVQPQNQTQLVASVGQMLAQQQQQTINNQQPAASHHNQQQQQQPVMSPSEIIESRFHVDYGNKRKRSQKGGGEHNESQDSKSERESLGNIETELELLNNKMRNRKYFVYIVNDGHFTAKKECIARIELPQKRRITLAEVRQLITNSQDISLSSLRRNKFKFVTETYRLLNENEDAAVLHQVYPTQGVFLKLNVPEQESQAYPYKSRSRLSSGSGPGGALATSQGGPSTLSQTTISSRRRAGTTGARRGGPDKLPAIEVDYAQGSQPRSRAASVGRRGPTSSGGASGGAPKMPLGSYRRSKSSVQTTARGRGQQRGSAGGGGGGLESDKLPSIGRFQVDQSQTIDDSKKKQPVEKPNTLSSAATDLGSKVLSGAKGFFNATFNR